MKYAVVCVDDDKSILDLLAFQLKKHFEPNSTWIETYTDPAEVENAIDELLEYGVDILFLIVDYQMPVINGATLIRKLKQKRPDLICFMLSGQANKLVVNDLMSSKLLYEFIEKPWDENKLVELILPFINKAKN
jgi:FixJ family two-component response regulator